MSKFVRTALHASLVAALAATSAQAQLLGGGLAPLPLPLPIGPSVSHLPVVEPLLGGVIATPAGQQAIQPTLDSVSGLAPAIAQSGAATLDEIRLLRLQKLIRDNPALLEADNDGNPIRRGVLIVANPNSASLQAAAVAGFRVLARNVEPQLGITVVELSAPAGTSARSAIKHLKKVAPELQAEFDPIFQPAGGALYPAAAPIAGAFANANGQVIGMIDGGVASHPSFRGASIEQNGFAGPPKPTGHGTAVASLLVGNQPGFHGAAQGARLYVADVYGGSAAAGSASVIVKAFAWLASKHAQVVNISLVGPPNHVLERAIGALQARGIQVVAAVGNDGPAAPPQYPASYPGVVSVTAVDSRGRALPEAGKPMHLDFAAPGADMAAALPGKGFAKVRGTSFASPLVAARLLRAGSLQRLAPEAQPGHGRVGRGIVCGPCRVDPRSVGAK